MWLLDLEAGGAPERLTTGREPVPYWADTAPRLSPDGSAVAYADDDHVWLVPTAGGPPRRLVEGDAPVWIDDARLIVAVERDATTRLAVVDVADPWPRRLAVEHGALDAHGDEGEAAVSPDGSEVAYTFTPRAERNRTARSASPPLDGGAVRAVSGAPDMHDNSPAWSPDGATIAYASERSGFYELHLAGAEERRLTSAGADHLELAWHPDGTRLVAVARAAQPLRPRGRRRSDRRGRGRRRGRDLGQPELDARGRDRRHLRGPRDAARAAPRRRAAAPRPRAARDAARARTPRSRRSRSPPSTAWRSRPSCAARRTFPREHPAAAVVYPHGGPTDACIDDWDGHAQYFVDKGYAWLAINFRGSTGYGRDYERLNHGVWGVDDTRDCLAAADYLRGLDWIDGDRLAIFGASYGSYMALRGGHRRPRAPLPLRRGQVRRLRHPHLLGAGRPRGRAGPRADDGPPVDARARRTRGLALPPPGRRRRRRCSSPTASSTSASAPSSPSSSSPSCDGWARPSST